MKNVIKLAAVTGLLFVSGCKWFSCCDHDHAKPTTAAATHAAAKEFSILEISSMADFEAKVLKADKPVVVDFAATWCGPCQEMKPMVHELAKELSDKYLFVAVDVDKGEEVAKHFSIQGVPTIMLVKNGKIVKTKVGGMSKGDFEKFMKEGFQSHESESKGEQHADQAKAGA